MSSKDEKKTKGRGEDVLEKRTAGSQGNSCGSGMTRRKVLKLLGVQVAAAGSLGATAFAAPKNFNPKHYNRGIGPSELPDTNAWLVTDPLSCVGCKTCEIVCSLTHDEVCQPAISRLDVMYDPLGSLAKIGSMPEVCKQCNMADCYLACAYDALVIDKETGARVIDPKKCRGCGECFAACPWNMIVYNKKTGTYTKCDLCGGDPECVKYCPANAIKFIELS